MPDGDGAFEKRMGEMETGIYRYMEALLAR